ncbi:MAG: hypothetical protein ACKD6O_08030 [Candidatus Bathyarchaeota archaeon]
MGKNRVTFVLSKRLYNFLKGRGKLHHCYICGKEFKVGDKVKSIVRGVKSRERKWVCLKCAKKYNIW